MHEKAKTSKYSINFVFFKVIAKDTILPTVKAIS